MSSQVLSLILFCTQISNNLASTGGPHEISRRAVVCRLPPPGQTKESARRDGGAAACLLCTTICFYCMALDHMFLLYGPKPHVSIVWSSAICFYCVALGHMFLLCVWTICFHRRLL